MKLLANNRRWVASGKTACQRGRSRREEYMHANRGIQQVSKNIFLSVISMSDSRGCCAHSANNTGKMPAVTGFQGHAIGNHAEERTRQWGLMPNA